MIDILFVNISQIDFHFFLCQNKNIYLSIS